VISLVSRSSYCQCEACGDRARYRLGVRCRRASKKEEAEALGAFALFVAKQEWEVEEALETLVNECRELRLALFQLAKPENDPMAPTLNRSPWPSR
jgi:hypothetical protein